VLDGTLVRVAHLGDGPRAVRRGRPPAGRTALVVDDGGASIAATCGPLARPTVGAAVMAVTVTGGIGTDSSKGGLVPTRDQHRRAVLSRHLDEALAADRDVSTLHAPITLYRLRGDATLIHADRKRCAMTGRKIGTAVVEHTATLRELLDDPKLCDCVHLAPGAFGAPRAHLDAVAALSQISRRLDQLVADPVPHRWILWIRLDGLFARLDALIDRFGLDEFADERAVLRARRGDVDATVVERWRRDRFTGAAAMWWRAQRGVEGRRAPDRTVGSLIRAGESLSEITAQGLVKGDERARVTAWVDTLCADAPGDPVRVVVKHSRDSDMRRVAYAQWGIADASDVHAMVLECPPSLLRLLDGMVVAEIPFPVDVTAAQLILELARPSYTKDEVVTALTAASLTTT
jgi:hypothetical protein